MQVPVLHTGRLELVSLSEDFLVASLAGERTRAEQLGGFQLPEEWPGTHESLLRMRLEDLGKDPSLRPWLLRALVRREPGRLMVGYANFHGAPDERRAVEMGYEVFPEYRRQGYAEETVRELVAWAKREHGIHHFVASVSPGNGPSLAMVRKLGFRQTGSQWDEVDGEELVFELFSEPLRGG
ncbi:GNAT family N-acetyltransferase [Stigmatella sp. ncwal1]|uniref:GNAT family N-acetyltransferase n=1 Tax=Stigmatella ashevillensis TaxID=2995309 RepID=A0ABT5DE79_9BACT|nr:GNAT family N-acetyltransferase [Stigmatella ashevillena]MDC0711923.1 GNAT family N-acetyltransferase [Stigmatella ashevillena]